jgi:hypothetical protein
MKHAPRAARREAEAGIGREHRPALVICLAAGFIAFLDVSIVNVALPTISAHLHASGSVPGQDELPAPGHGEDAICARSTHFNF